MMAERFLTTAEAAEALGLPGRRVYDLMASGIIESWCINPGSQRRRYLTTRNALGRFQAAALVRDRKKVVTHETGRIERRK